MEETSLSLPVVKLACNSQTATLSGRANRKSSCDVPGHVATRLAATEDALHSIAATVILGKTGRFLQAGAGRSA